MLSPQPQNHSSNLLNNFGDTAHFRVNDISIYISLVVTEEQVIVLLVDLNSLFVKIHGMA